MSYAEHNVYQLPPLTPLPLVIELDAPECWIAWDSVIRELDNKENAS